ncbi:ATP-dependent transcriptional regulator (plasmid) [Mycobacterium sp. JS623]|uniref:helix-turn-helix transcriptional regulator n=1 Tax=Mycobacterium sp. JS623 TaxID=212767 RepID=UPI0002A5BAA6|nr:LuxR family transcriptional regulator [Mycobacterium sp. JS623]AGB26880.1 ATP-dependent transcriptional regulator [Mycobacterium sp. JS623]
MVHRWPLTGRGEELRLISETLTEEHHKGMVVAGLAGVGKTRLARAATEAAAHAGWAVRRIAGTTTGRPVSLGAFARWVDDTDSSPTHLTQKLFSGLTAGAEGAPLLVFVDDAHLLDDMSAMLVHQLVLQDVASVIATIRTGEPAPDAVRALWKDGLLPRLELQPLSRNESDDLLNAVLGGPISTDCTDRMWKLSRGNVLFLHHLVEHERASGRLVRVDGEWCWAGTPSASPSLVELVEQQIGAVPDEIQEVVDLVAIAEPIDRVLLAALADPLSIEATEQRGLITAPSASDVVFVGHPLYGEIRLSQCGPSRLRRLRGQVATAMAQGKAADPIRLALLWMESDLPPNADILSRAANISASRLDLALAERLGRAAVAANASPEAKLALARILVLHDKGEAAEELLDTLEADEGVTAGFFDEAIVRAANLLWPQRNPGEARRVIDSAIALGDDDRNHALRTFLAVIQATAAEPDQTIRTMAAVDYDHLDDYGRAVGYSTETIALGDVGRIEAANQRAAAGYRVLEETPEEYSFHGTGLAEFHAYALLAAGYVDQAFAIAEREYQSRAQFPDMSRWMAIATVGMAALAKGDLALAIRHLGPASKGLDTQNDISGLLYRFSIMHTEALARSGRIDAAAAAMEATRQLRHPSFAYVESGYLLASAWVGAAHGRTAEARQSACRAAEFARAHGQPAREVLALQTAVQLGDAAGSDRLAELANQVDGPRAPLSAQYADALARDDSAGLEAVSRDFETMGDILAAADASAQAAASHRLAGRRGSALSASGRAQLLAKQCGGALSPALVASRVPLPFTRREHEIANLVSRGMSNKDIAQATSLSIRTIEGHIYQASAKAGVSSRSELSTLVRQFNEVGAPTI